ncbi:magnesium transporter NIPA-domain-containing protein [Dichomitus squalens]|nr:magnesium transporter NIPA-domain-containing protein [Dichomitus squalens]
MHVPRHLLGGLDDLPGGIDLPQISTSTAAGISAAVAGNILISLALNCQKLAHRRLEREREQAANAPQPLKPTHSNGHLPSASSDEVTPTASPLPTAAVLETEPLLPEADGLVAESPKPGRSWFFLRRKAFRNQAYDAESSHLAGTHALMPFEVVRVTPDGSGLHEEQKHARQDAAESDYLRSKLWWFGFLLMNLGETGNFISYAFAPASVVAPLGTFALIANCIFAPLMLKERFRKRDFFGIIIAILGAVTVVLSTDPSDTRLDPKGLIAAITTRPFEIYAVTYAVGIVILSGLSEGPAGKRYVFVDVGLCALFGGFTVLSTKAVSTLLTMEWFAIFKEWITYPVIAVLLITGVGQIRYLNRALMRFDSKVVVPTQFVTFNLSAIVGSAILYGDFKKATFHQLVTFLYGCGATFLGVFIIAWAPVRPSSDPEEEEDGAGADDDADTDPTSAETLTIFSPVSSTSPLGADNASTIPAPAYGSVRIARSSLSRRSRPTLAVPDSGASGSESGTSPVLRNRHSIVSLYGFSPAQRVLLISSSPPDEVFVRPNLDPERERDPNASPESLGRRRAISWLDESFSARSSSAHSQSHLQSSPRRGARYGATTTTTTTTTTTRGTTASSSVAASRETSRVRPAQDRTRSKTSDSSPT